MSVFENTAGYEAISPGELDMLIQTLDVWCADRKIQRKHAQDGAVVLLDTYRNGKRSQVDLLDALNAMR